MSDIGVELIKLGPAGVICLALLWMLIQQRKDNIRLQRSVDERDQRMSAMQDRRVEEARTIIPVLERNTTTLDKLVTAIGQTNIRRR